MFKIWFITNLQTVSTNVSNKDYNNFGIKFKEHLIDPSHQEQLKANSIKIDTNHVNTNKLTPPSTSPPPPPSVPPPTVPTTVSSMTSSLPFLPFYDWKIIIGMYLTTA